MRDIHGEIITSETQSVYAIKNQDEFHGLDPDLQNGEPVILGQCEDCGNSASFTVRTEANAPYMVLCDPNRIDENTRMEGCGRQMRVRVMLVGNEARGVVI